MESMNKKEYQTKLKDLQAWHKDRFQSRIHYGDEHEQLIPISLYALTQFLITKELHQLNNEKGEDDEHAN
jgi:hypothetical protein